MSCLTPRQAQILDVLLTGKTNDEIAAQLGIRENTVKRHLADAAERAGFPGCNRVELAVWWTRHRLVAA